MRAGAGYVTALVPASLEAIFETRLLEVMTRGLADDDGGALTPAAVEDALEATAPRRRARARPRRGPQRRARSRSLRELAARAEVALLLDADGLNAHAGALEALAGARAARRS